MLPHIVHQQLPSVWLNLFLLKIQQKIVLIKLWSCFIVSEILFGGNVVQQQFVALNIVFEL